MYSQVHLWQEFEHSTLYHECIKLPDLAVGIQVNCIPCSSLVTSFTPPTTKSSEKMAGIFIIESVGSISVSLYVGIADVKYMLIQKKSLKQLTYKLLLQPTVHLRVFS